MASDNEPHARLRQFQDAIGLSDHEQRVLELILVGKHNKAIAQQLDLPLRRIEFIRAIIIRKFESGTMQEVLTRLRG